VAGLEIFTAATSAREAAETFRTFKEGKPNLIPTGFPVVDAKIGGLFPGSPGILGALTGVGKTSLALGAAVRNAECGVPTGYISLEDTPDILGSRLWAYASGVDSMKIRRKELDDDDVAALKTGKKRLSKQQNLSLSYPISQPINVILDHMKAHAQEYGAKMIIVDYLQKIRDDRIQERRNQVSGAFAQLHRVAAELNTALLLVSQVSRQSDPTKPLSIHAQKESGDLENEARLILLAYRPSAADTDRVTVRIAKSTFGGGGTTFDFERGRNGWLYPSGDNPEF